jgi:hypothetical protein
MEAVSSFPEIKGLIMKKRVRRIFMKWKGGIGFSPYFWGPDDFIFAKEQHYHNYSGGKK